MLDTHSFEFIDLIINSSLEAKELSKDFNGYKVLGRKIGIQVLPRWRGFGKHPGFKQGMKM